jgi:hypothetical protein
METAPLSLIAAVILALAYLFSDWFSGREASEKFWKRRKWISAAAGVSVAYVFVDLLPELAAQQQEFARAPENAGLLLVEERLYSLALASFVLLYGLDHMVFSRREGRRQDANTGDSDAVYWTHLAGFAAYSAMIGYLLVERAERGVLPLAFYTFAMAVHFLIVGHSMAEENARRYRSLGGWLLALSVLTGCLLGMTTQISGTTFARLFAVLAGGVVITSLVHELPGDRQGRFWPFCSGAVVFALALFVSEAAVP